jgi:hypothetical protein
MCRHSMNTCRLRLTWTAFTVAMVLPAHGAPGTNDSKQTTERISALQSIIIPPAGTDKSQVDTVYGMPKEVESQGMGSSADYPMHIYQLLPPQKKEEFRAFLYATYRDGRLRNAAINHICVAGGRIPPLWGSEAGLGRSFLQRFRSYGAWR